jgi:diguanylate cyclase (GGDEF)-like protein
MSIIASIRSHTRGLYHTTQVLLLISMAAVGVVVLEASEDGLNKTVLLASICSIGLALCTFEYMRRVMVQRLASAAAAESEEHRRLSTDAVSGAMTRRYFMEMLERSIGGMGDRKDGTLILLDLDHFKQLNDTFGHSFGDSALRHLAATAGRIFDDGVVGRLGGDEFGVTVPHADLDRICSKANELLAVMQSGTVHEGRRVPFGVSMGIAAAPTHGSSASDLMFMADVALYESKATGRNRLTVFEAEMLAGKRQRRLIERELRAAVYLNELELYYQPVVNADCSIFALEALVRWRHPVRGVISPSEFIPVAEHSTLIDLVGEWVFKRACADITQFPGKRISINVSGEQLKRDEVVLMAQRVLHESGRVASQFVLEITETAATAATPEVLARIQRLKELGFRIALDDFGTGHCGFNYLKTLPINSIKIDRSYINRLANDEVAQVFVSALAQIGRIQDLTIVAEGIETAEEFKLARAAGCTRFQGYFIGRPMPRKEVSGVLDLQNASTTLTA